MSLSKFSFGRLQWQRLLARVVAVSVVFAVLVGDAVAQRRPAPPKGWAKFDWPRKKEILFGTFAPTEKEVERIREAMPEPLGDEGPESPRRLLVFYQCKHPHASIATGTKAFELMGAMTGAYEATLSDDPADFREENLSKYDAVLLNNTTSFSATIGEEGRMALIRYVRSGGGLIGIHAAADSSYGWKEGTELIGGVFAGHPWLANGTWAFRLQSPDHPLNAAFEGENFLHRDEVYRYREFSAERSRVLLSLDMSDQRNLSGPGFKDSPKRPVETDQLHPVAWVHRFGGGRVFYSNLGHNASTYWQPAVLRHYLDGIRFALGDLEADATASTPPPEPAAAPAA